ncbi:hypothetical protein JCM5350_007262 [Sporobolomyces pararoseus]
MGSRRITSLAKGKIEFKKYLDSFLDSTFANVRDASFNQPAIINLRKNVALFRKEAKHFASENFTLTKYEPYDFNGAYVVDLLVERLDSFKVPELLIPGSFPFQSELYHRCLVSMSNVLCLFRGLDREGPAREDRVVSPLYGIKQFTRFLEEKVKPSYPSVYRKILANSPAGFREEVETDPFQTGDLEDMKSWMEKHGYDPNRAKNEAGGKGLASSMGSI